jgi:hypothetical protein
MTEHDLEFWNKAVDAREELVEQWADDPNVVLIDLGYPPAECHDAAADEVVVRVHVSEEWLVNNPDGWAALQEAAGNIPVCVVCDSQ